MNKGKTLLSGLSDDVRQYMVITANYWTFTLTDGALRMLIILYFYNLGYSPLQLAMLFLFYEIFGVITNLFGGWLGAHFGLNKTMNVGLFMQVLALSMLLVPSIDLTIPWVMTAQAFSGIAKDLNKMSAKSAIKLLVPSKAPNKLYRWIAILTGSKNTLKGIGFFLGGLLLTLMGFQGAILVMVIVLFLVWLLSIFKLKTDLGKAKNKPKFNQLFSKSPAINYLSAARLFLFASRDVWFVVALPVYLVSVFNWTHATVGSFLSLWIIGYGFIQTIAPKITRRQNGTLPDGKMAFGWALLLAIIPGIIATGLILDFAPQKFLLIGLLLFGIVFAINSSLHSFLIVHYATDDGVSLDVGFYYMANAVGRLIGTVLSGWLYQNAGLEACLWLSTVFIVVAALFSLSLQKYQTNDRQT